AGPADTVYPGANDNAAAIGVMLEMLRAWQEANYHPNRTFLFVAYAGNGYETGQNPELPLDIERFLTAKQGFSSAFQIEAVVFLQGLGDGEAKVMEMGSGGNLRLLNLFDDAASQVGLKTSRTREGIELSGVVTRQQNVMPGDSDAAPNITISFKGWARNSGLPSDDLSQIKPDWMESIGEALSTALMTIGQETIY
ncbi:MAG TPA: Zn-dependent exopeptidase M28, partial [Caldilineae bacterium]|nr:Zn-dependent exopeptidase M28 [Caldilineae bacterium]